MPIFQPHHPAALVPHRRPRGAVPLVVGYVLIMIVSIIELAVPVGEGWRWASGVFKVALLMGLLLFVLVRQRQPVPGELQIEVARARLEAALERYRASSSFLPRAVVSPLAGDEMASRLFARKSTFGPQLIHWLRDEELDWLVAQHQAQSRRGYDLLTIFYETLRTGLGLTLLIGVIARNPVAVLAGIPAFGVLIWLARSLRYRQIIRADADAVHQTGDSEAAIRALYKMHAPPGQDRVSEQTALPAEIRRRIVHLRDRPMEPTA